MSKRVFVVHGWDSHPEDGWLPWLKKELESHDFKVTIPQLPETGTPKIENWVPALAESVGTADSETYFIGHSMGNQAIARYLETLPDGAQVGGAVFVAGFFKRLTNLEDDEVRAIAAPWFEIPLDLAKVKSHLPKAVAVFSDNDKYVPLDNQEDFKDKLGAEIIIKHEHGHFSGQSDGCAELPVVLDSILKISK